MLDAFTNYFWQHPVAILVAAIAAVIILIWMTGSGSRHRFITVKRTKETEQLARDVARIASALEKIARQRDTPMDYLNRPVPHGWEATISAGEPVEDPFSAEQGASEQDEQRVEETASPVAADADHQSFTTPISSRSSVSLPNPSARNAANVPSSPSAPAQSNAPASAPSASRESATPRRANPNPPADSAAPARENSAPESGAAQNPFSGTADLLGGKKKLDLPNPLYRPKR